MLVLWALALQLLASRVEAVPATKSTSAAACTCTQFSQIAAAVKACTSITLQDIAAPSGGTIDLSKLKANTVVTFAGTTTFAKTSNDTFNPILVGGTGITIRGAAGSLIDGNGPVYWDGLGSNGGVNKPDHFIKLSKVKGGLITGLHIKNWPVHLFDVTGCDNVEMSNMLLNNTDGDAPNAVSKGIPAGHNSDAIDMSSTTNSYVHNITVYNQDDCVAITSGSNITVSNMYCEGGHGMSIGSIGGKSDNDVSNIIFENSVIINSDNGARIKTNYQTTGSVTGITYRNIQLQGIKVYGIDVQQDYLNGGPTGIPSNGVKIANLVFQNITGTAVGNATDYYILCGSGSCTGVTFSGVSITGGGTASSCNIPNCGMPTS